MRQHCENMESTRKRQKAVLQGHTDSVNSVAITSDNKYIVSGGADKTVGIWNFQDKTREAALQGHTEMVICVAITSDNKYIVSGGFDKAVGIKYDQA